MIKQEKQIFEKAIKTVRKNETEVIRLLKKKWPIGKDIVCFIKQGQKKPSTVKVVGYNGVMGTIQVQIAPDSGNRRFLRDIPFDKILD